MSKIIDLAGTTLSYFKIGKTGPRIKNNAGVLETKNTDDTLYSDFMTRTMRLFSNGLIKTIFESDATLASDLTLVTPPTKGVTESFLQSTPDPVLNKAVTSFQPIKLDNISLVKQGTGSYATSGGGIEVEFNYTPVPTPSFLGTTSFSGSSYTATNTGRILTVNTRVDNGFANTGAMTAYLVLVPGVLPATVIPIAQSAPVNFNPGTYPAGTYISTTFNFGIDAQVLVGNEYAIVYGTTAGVFLGVGTNQANSRTFIAVAPGFTTFNLAGSQNTNYMIVIIDKPSVSSFTTDSAQYLGVRNLPLDYHQIDPISTAFDEGDIMYVTINRTQAAPTILVPVVQPVASFVPDQNKVIIGRVSNGVAYFGIDDQIYISNGSTVNLTGAPSSTSLLTKSGIIPDSNFAGGPPLVAPVGFSTPFPDANYSIVVLGVDSRAWSYESKDEFGFIVNSNSGTALTGEVSWIAIYNGETV